MLEEFLQAVGYGLCHQLPERSFFGGAYQVPVCARDMGIYVGFAVSLAVIALLSRGRRPSEMPPVWLMVLGVLFVLLMALDGVTSYAGLRTTTNDIRLITGLLTGFGLTLALVPVLNGQLWRQPGRDRLLGRTSDALLWLLSIPLLFVLLRWVMPYFSILFPLLVVVAILVTFTAVNLAIVCLLPPFEMKAQRLRDAWLPILIAFGLTLFLLAATAGLRVVLERSALGT
jgi:uncharacterized membrane protein